MASVAYFVMLPFIRDVDGELVGEEGKEAPNGFVPKARAMVDRVAGAIAFSRTGDPSMGDFEPAVILGRYGEVPGDLDALTMG